LTLPLEVRKDRLKLMKPILEETFIIDKKLMEDHRDRMAASIYARSWTRHNRTLDEVKKSVNLTAVEFAVAQYPGWMMNPMDYESKDKSTWAFDCLSDTGLTMECKRWKRNYGMLNFQKKNFETFLDHAEEWVDFLFSAEVEEDDSIAVVRPRLICDAPSFHSYIGPSRFDNFKTGDEYVYNDLKAVRDGLAYTKKNPKKKR